MARKIPARSVLEQTIQRVIAFLAAIGKYPVIRAILEEHGYNDDEHLLGWSLLHQATGYKAPAPGIAIDSDPAVREAIMELDAWDEPNFARVKAALERRFPDQAEFMFENLEAQTGAAAVMSVATFLERFQALETGEGRPKEARKDDLAACKLLVSRGYTRKLRDHLADLIQTAQKGAEGAKKPEPDPKADQARAEQEQALVDLYFWHKDWATTARTVIKRRDYLIRLGIGKRRKATKPGTGGEEGGEGGDDAEE